MGDVLVLVCARFGKVRKLAEAEGGSTQADASHPAKLPFGKLLAWHLRRGTRPGRRSERAWRTADFADRLGVSDRTVRNWIKGETCPSTIEPIERELFGPEPVDDDALLKLREAFAITRQRADLAPAAALTPPDRCLGRDGDAAALTGAVVHPSGATAAILGSPGIGKSTLARHVVTSAAVVERFRERRWWVELQAATSAASLRTAILLAVSLDPAVHKFPKALELLGRSPALLVLDNLETPWERDMDAVQDCLRQLAAVPDIALLVSLRGNVAPTGPAFAHQQVLGPLPEDAAQRLFLDLARHIDPCDPALRPLLRDLGGVPLAIELIAIRAAPHSFLGDIWEEWQRRGIVLATHPDFQEGRMTSLVRSIDLSVQSPRLHAPGRRLFWLLGQLAGGMARVDAAILLDNDATEAKRQLLATGLAFSHGPDRMDLLPPVRQFARTILQVPVEDAQSPWCAHYLGLAAALGPLVGSNDGLAATTRLKPEIANLEAAFAAAKPLVIEQTGVPAALGFAEFARFSGLGDPAPLIVVSNACRDAGDVSGEAHCTRSLGDIMRDRSSPELALAAYQRASQLFQQINDTLCVATCLQNSSDVAFDCADYKGALRFSKQAYEIFKKAGHVVGIADCAKNLSQISSILGDCVTARKCLEVAIKIFLAAGDTVRTADRLQTSADISLDLFDLENARNLYERALPLFRKIGSHHGEANCIWGLGAVEFRASNYDVALTAFEQACPLYKQVGSVLGEANCTMNIGEIFLLRGDLEKARSSFLEALSLYQHIKSVQSQSCCFRNLGEISLAQSDFDKARSMYEQSILLSESASDHIGIGLAHFCFARVSEGTLKTSHLQKARESWTLIASPDLLTCLDEFSAEI